MMSYISSGLRWRDFFLAGERRFNVALALRQADRLTDAHAFARPRSPTSEPSATAPQTTSKKPNS
jgi:hypothetical protein